jgi:hypothetical protein
MVAGLAVLGVSACKVSVSTGKAVAKADVEKEISDQLKAKVGVAPKKVTCPGDLGAKVGTEMRCTLTADDGTAYGLTVSVTTVNGKAVDFDINVDDTPATAGASTSTTG